MNTKLNRHNFNQELELILTYFSNHVMESKSYIATEKEVKFTSYLLGLVIEKYWKEK